MKRLYVLILIITSNACYNKSQESLPLIYGGWQLVSIQLDKKKIYLDRNERYYFNDDGTLVFHSQHADLDFNYKSTYGLSNVNGKKFLIEKNPFYNLSPQGDTIIDYNVYEIKELTTENLVLKFNAKFLCEDSTLGCIECPKQRIHSYKRLEWNPNFVNDSIPVL